LLFSLINLASKTVFRFLLDTGRKIDMVETIKTTSSRLGLTVLFFTLVRRPPFSNFWLETTVDESPKCSIPGVEVAKLHFARESIPMFALAVCFCEGIYPTGLDRHVCKSKIVY
jgi:hypothetical protein